MLVKSPPNAVALAGSHGLLVSLLSVVVVMVVDFANAKCVRGTESNKNTSITKNARKEKELRNPTIAMEIYKREG